MEGARGLAHLYPVVPIMNFLSMLLLLLIIPGFWRTRIVALVSLVIWIFVGNLVSFLCKIYWRGHTNDAPVWATIRESVIVHALRFTEHISDCLGGYMVLRVFHVDGLLCTLYLAETSATFRP
jgi:hypothetical protein